MSRAKTSAEETIQWLIGSPKDATMTESARTAPQPVAHDSYRQLLLRLEPDSSMLWAEAKDEVDPDNGILILDDTTLDKPYGPKIAMVTKH
ncbi:MAG: hypothetical protein AAFV53_13535 [Myxococcota bacterium]